MQEIRPIGPDAVHVCIDMQRLFAEHTAWHTASIPDILPNVIRLTEHAPQRTVFTRFRTPPKPADAHGHWRRYYERWSELTTDVMGEAMLDVMAELASFVPPARIAEKTGYSAFESAEFRAMLDDLGCETVICSGVETDVCVLGTVMQAMDLGYRVVIADDAVHGSVPDAHQATLDHVYRRFDEQIEIGSTTEVIANWTTP